MDRFDLEESIMDAWRTSDDLDLIIKTMYDNEPISEDETMNLLMGLSALHNARSKKLFDVYEQLISQL